MADLEALLVKYAWQLVVLLLVVVIGLLAWLYIGHLQAEVVQAKAAAVQSKDTAIVASGQAAATSAAAAIEAQGEQRTAADLNTHQDNANAIQSAQGAATPVPAAVNTAGRDGLCRYAAYSGDPGCAGLQQVGPAQLPQTGGGNAPPGG